MTQAREKLQPLIVNPLSQAIRGFSQKSGGNRKRAEGRKAWRFATAEHPRRCKNNAEPQIAADANNLTPTP